MALTSKQIWNLESNIIRPESMLLIDLIGIVAYKHAAYFLDTQKETDPGTLADSYRLKMENISIRVKQKDGNSLLSLKDALIRSIWGNVKNYTDIKAWDDENWENNVNDYIGEVFEKAANVTNAERVAYNGL